MNSLDIKIYKEPLMTGAFSVVLGLAAKKMFRSDYIHVGTVKQAGISFVLISLAAVAAKEAIKDKYI